MKILFDSQIFDSQKYGGISRYFCEIFKFLNKKKIQYEMPVEFTINEYIKQIEPFAGLGLKSPNKYKWIIHPLPRKIFSKIIDILNPKSNLNKTIKVLKNGNFDVFHPTYYSSYFLRYLKNKPMVLTVHDMIHELFPEYFTIGFLTVKEKRKLIQRADKIIAISNSTKNDILHFYNIPEEKISVIYHGNSLKPISYKPEKLNTIPKRYILYVGARGAYKNFIFFVNSIASILNQDSDLFLVVAGGYSGKDIFNPEEISVFNKLNIQDKILYYSINDDELAYLYQNATCFAFPTLYEGFGIPVLEAFACSCPVVLSNTSSLPEVGGDAAIYFDPRDSNDILRAVKSVIYDDSLRQELILKGQIQLNKFSWDKTGEETLAVYKNILEK